MLKVEKLQSQEVVGTAVAKKERLSVSDTDV